jgi:hypothetical protein
VLAIIVEDKVLELYSPCPRGTSFILCPASIEFARPFGTVGEIDSGRLLLLKISFKIYMLQLFGAACQVALAFLNL